MSNKTKENDEIKFPKYIVLREMEKWSNKLFKTLHKTFNK